jgi:hypothetical protein
MANSIEVGDLGNWMVQPVPSLFGPGENQIALPTQESLQLFGDRADAFRADGSGPDPLPGHLPAVEELIVRVNNSLFLEAFRADGSVPDPLPAPFPAVEELIVLVNHSLFLDSPPRISARDVKARVTNAVRDRTGQV